MNRLKELLFTTPVVVPLTLLIVFGLAALYGYSMRNPTNLQNNTAMIVNKAMNHGGTGVVYSSTKQGSYVLTNDHVCKAIKEGGVVKTTLGTFQVQAMLESEVSDLCLTFTTANLKENTKVSAIEPVFLDDAKVSGHPALMPTIVSKGHFSDRAIIQVVTGFKPCTEADLADPINGMLCIFFGGTPIIKSYESILVSATIMPGSSGSGVYNSNNELAGLVFAGSGDFGYAWTVPYDQVLKFLSTEVYKGKWQTLDQEIHFGQQDDASKHLKDVLKKCTTATDEKIIGFCSLLKRDAMWVK